MRGHYEEGFLAWREWAGQDPGAGPFILDIAPDRLHKNNVSGGAPYGIVVPDPCADGQFVGEEGDDPVPFVSYLNDAFAHGGFPYGEYPWLPALAAARSRSRDPSTRTCYPFNLPGPVCRSGCRQRPQGNPHGIPVDI